MLQVHGSALLLTTNLAILSEAPRLELIAPQVGQAFKQRRDYLALQVEATCAGDKVGSRVNLHKSYHQCRCYPSEQTFPPRPPPPPPSPRSSVSELGGVVRIGPERSFCGGCIVPLCAGNPRGQDGGDERGAAQRAEPVPRDAQGLARCVAGSCLSVRRGRRGRRGSGGKLGRQGVWASFFARQVVPEEAIALLELKSLVRRLCFPDFAACTARVL